jgi:hypothetical protein
LAAFVVLGSLRICAFNPIASNPDASWQAVLGEAATHGEKFGRDLIFTGGPLSAFYTRYFDSVQWPWILVAGALLATTLAWSCARLASTWIVAALLPACLLIAYPDAVLLAVPALAALAILARPNATTALVVLAAIATAALALAKFSVVPVAAVAFIVIDAEFVHERRLPVGVITFCAAMAGWFAILQGGLTYFCDFLRFSLETSAGYGAAMSLEGSRLELSAFIALAISFAALLFYSASRPAMPRSMLTHGLAIIALADFCFIGFKAGFIRHDLHSLIAWSVLALAAAAYAGWECRTALRRLSVALAVTAAAAAAIVFHTQTGIWPLTIASDRLQEARNSLSSLVEIALHPSDWAAAQRGAMAHGRAALRESMPLPKLQGSVDTLASIQSAAIAAELDYRPRFTIQEYTSYTAALIAKNRESWFGPRAPTHIIFGLDDVIDARYPALAEGPLWPDLLRFYEPKQRLDGGNLVVLGRRQHPLPEILSAPVRQTTQLGERIAIGPAPTFLTLDIRLNWLGRLLALLFKPPIVHLQFEYLNRPGWQSEYRIIPAIVREGFVISPRIDIADDFAALARGDDAAFSASSRPVAARVVVDALGAWAYDHHIDATLQTIDTGVLAASRPTMSRPDESPHMSTALQRLLDAVPLQPPWVRRVPEGLAAYAPRRILIPAKGAQAITVTFGLRDGAWTLGRTEGACFRATTEAGVELWRRCLDPRRTVADRGPQQARFALPADQPRIALETLCGRSYCDWGWTYWGALRRAREKGSGKDGDIKHGSRGPGHQGQGQLQGAMIFSRGKTVRSEG